MFSLMPRDESFFDLFTKTAENAHEAANLLADFLDRYEDVENKAARIKNVEHAGDQLTHHAIEKLNKTFITPIDREDIHELICRIDDVVDMIDTAVNRMLVYKIVKPTEDAKALARVLQQATAVMVRAMGLLKDMKNPDAILQSCIEIHTHENEGDRIEHHALAALFENAKDPLEVIKWKDIYEELEAATDRCEDVANVLESIVLKNA